MTQATNTTVGTLLLAGDLFGNDANTPTLVTSGVTPIVTPRTVSKVHVDTKGRITWQGPGNYSTDISPIMPNGNKTDKGAVAVGLNIDVTAGLISIADATSTTPGAFQTSTGLTAVAGVVSVDATIIPAASAGSFGQVTIGEGFEVTDGVLSNPGGADATAISKGLVQIGSNVNVASGVISVPDCSTSVKGVVRPGPTMIVVDGVLSIPDASTTVRGLVNGVVPGKGLDIDVDGSLTFDPSTLPIAGASTFGKVQVGAGFIIDEAGALAISTADYATVSTKGTVQVGTGFEIAAGVLSVPNSLPTAKGVIEVNTTNGLTITSGILDIDKATNTTKGTVKPTGNLTAPTDGCIDVSTNVVKLNTVNTYTKAQVSEKRISTFNAAFTVDLANQNTREITLTGNITSFAAPTNAVPGMVATFILIQDGTGNRTLSGFDSKYKFNQTVTLSTAPGAIDIMTIICKDANTFYVMFAPGYI